MRFPGLSTTFAALVLFALPAHGQRTAPIVAETDSTYKVIVGTDTLYAVTNSMRRAHMKALVDLNAARQTIKVQDSVIAAYDGVVQAGQRAISLDSASIVAQRAQIADFRALVAALEKKLRRANPLISIEAGAGLNRDGLGAIGAVGIRRLRLWGTLQEQGSGVFAGLFLPIF